MVAFAVAALTFALASVAVHPSSSPKFTLTSGPGTTITSNIYASPACSGATAELYPGTPRCLVFTVHNTLSVPVTVTSISMALDGSFPPLPVGCPVTDYSFPSFTGSFVVPAKSSGNSPGLPISLTDTDTNQDACQDATLHFVYTSSAQYTDSSTTALSVSPNPPVAGQPVTFTATVTADNPGEDPTGPSGTVNFYSCSNAACTDPVLIGSGTIGPNGQATFTTSTLTAGGQYFQAVYEGAGTSFSASTSAVFVTTVAPAPPTTTTTSPTHASTSALAFTGADLALIVGGGLAFLGAGALVLFYARRRDEAES